MKIKKIILGIILFILFCTLPVLLSQSIKLECVRSKVIYNIETVFEPSIPACLVYYNGDLIPLRYYKDTILKGDKR